MKMKQCTKCKKWFPATTEYFNKNKNGKYGLYSLCRKCDNEKNKKYYLKNLDRERKKRREYAKLHKEQRKGYWKDYYRENKDKVLEKEQEWRRDNPNYEREYRKQHPRDGEERRKYDREYYQKNKKKLRERYYRYYWNNLEKYRNFCKKWSKLNPEKTKLMSVKRRSRKRNLLTYFTQDKWGYCLNFFECKCAYCGRQSNKLQQEHIIAVSNNGHYIPQNIIPCCRSCNLRKNNSNMEAWYRKQSFYSIERLKRIYIYQTISILKEVN